MRESRARPLKNSVLEGASCPVGSVSNAFVDACVLRGRRWQTLFMRVWGCLWMTTLLVACSSLTSEGPESDASTVSETSVSEESSSSESTGTGTSSTESSSTDDGGWVPDAGEPCGESCHVWSLDECPTGQKCTWVACEVGSSSWDSTVCRDIQGEGSVGDECSYVDESGVSGNDTCGEGLMCWALDPDTGLGYCAAFCLGDYSDPQCPGGTHCAFVSQDFSLCWVDCDPLQQDCPTEHELCLPDPGGEGYSCRLDASGDMAPYGSPCNFANACNAGLLCLAAAAVPEPGL